MGDRGNVKVLMHSGLPEREGREDAVYLYAHWAGTELPILLQRALARRERWQDESYLARIIFCEMVKGEEDGETGYGIASYQPDNEHPILVVDCEKQQVRIEDAQYGRWGGEKREWSFDDFVALHLTTVFAEF